MVADLRVSLQPVQCGHQSAIERFLLEPETLGLDWPGFGDLAAFRARLSTDGYLGPNGGLLAVVEDENCVGAASWQATHYGGPAPTWRIGVAVLPEARGRGIARSAQRLLCAYLFEHTTAQRTEAVVRTDNLHEHRALDAISFSCDGVLQQAQFKQGRFQDLKLYSVLRPAD